MTLAYDMELLIKALQDVAALSKEIFTRHGRQLNIRAVRRLATAHGFAGGLLEVLGAAPRTAREGGPATK